MPLHQPPHILSQAKGSLNRLLQQSRALLDLQQAVRKLVPGDIYVAQLADRQLHLITPSAALATRINYARASLIASLRQRQNPYDIDSIKVSVRPQDFPPARPARRVQPLSSQSAEQIRRVANYIDDPTLRDALNRLASRADDTP